jgi:hypothetical protein
MSYPLKRLNPIHDPKSNSEIAHEILIAIDTETLKLVWLLPLSCAIVLNKAISYECLSLKEHFVLVGLHSLIHRKPQTQSWVRTLIESIFYEIIEEEEHVDDYT